MIRTSAIVAAIAGLLSLLLHLMGISLLGPSLSDQQASQGSENAVELGTSFEDFAELAPEPVQPETAEIPEPPKEETVEPEPVEIPISETLVASPDPKRVSSPDIGSSEPVEPDTQTEAASEPAEAENTETASKVEPTVTQPVESETLDESDENSPAPTTPEPERLAALPPSENTAVVAVPSEDAEINSEASDEATQEASESESDISEQAVVVSKRPRLPAKRPTEKPKATLDGFKNFDNLRNPQRVVESPLSRYQKDGTDPFRTNDKRNRAGGRGTGNSDTTNYAGQVLIHLNRAPVVYVSTRGFAQVFFEINPDGTLAWVDIVDSSGSPELERAAREQVRRAAPFPAPPSGRSRKLSFYYQNG